MSEFNVRVSGQPPRILGQAHPTLTLGRAADQDVVLEEPTISRHHARLHWRDGAAWIEDLGSRHGCHRNGRRIREPERLEPGDRLTLGRLEVSVTPVAPMDVEQTPLSLSVQDLRRWSLGGEDLGRLAKWREALDILHDVSLLMLEDLDPGQLLGRLLDHLFPFLDAGRGAVLHRNAEGVLVPLAARGRSPEGPLSLPPETLEATLSRRVAMVFREGPSDRGGGPLLADSGTTSVMAVPLEHDGQVLGLLYFDAAAGRGPFTELDLRFVASLGNLAAAKLLQQRLAQELQRKEELEREARAREAAARAKTEFLAQMSHEIRTPMNAVLGFAHLAREEVLTPRTADYLRKIELSGRSLMGLVGDILDFSRIEAGRLALESVPFRPRDVLEQALDLFRLQAAEKGLALELSIPDPLPSVLLGDPLRLGQVLSNLVGNALKFTERGLVRLQAEVLQEGPAGVRLRFSVRDTGIGIDPARVKSLFEPYEQGDPSVPRQYGGSGLGLAIARELVERMGGTLEVSSAPGEGSLFAFALDLPRGREPEPGRAPDLRGCRILLVEDHPLNQQLASTFLREAGAEVDLAGDGARALDLAAARAYSAVIMDLQLPGIDGCETARRLRDLGCETPILALTAQARTDGLWLEAGMNDYILKPIEPRLLFEALGRWVRPAAALPPPPEPVPPAQAVPEAALAALAPVMDVARALERLGGRQDLLAGFVRSLLADPIEPRAISEAMALGDRAGAYRQAHDLKGIASSLALGRIADGAAALEARLQEEGAAGWAEACAELQAAMDAFRACAGAALGG